MSIVVTHAASSIAFHNCTFCAAPIAVCNQAHASFKDCVFTSVQGTAVKVLAASARLHGCEVCHCAGAAALEVAAAGKVTCEACDIHDCAVAAAVWHQGQLICTETTITDCSRGGVCALGQSASVCLTDTELQDCHGTALLLKDSAHALLSSVHVTGSKAADDTRVSRWVGSPYSDICGIGIVLAGSRPHVRAETCRFADNAIAALSAEDGDACLEGCHIAAQAHKDSQHCLVQRTVQAGKQCNYELKRCTFLTTAGALFKDSGGSCYNVSGANASLFAAVTFEECQCNGTAVGPSAAQKAQ